MMSRRYALEFARGILRIRVAGDCRVLYTVDDDRLVVLVVDAGHPSADLPLASWPVGQTGYMASITKRRAELAGRLWDLGRGDLLARAGRLPQALARPPAGRGLEVAACP